MNECVFRDTVPTGTAAFRDFDTADQPTARTGGEELFHLPGHLAVPERLDRDVRAEVRVGGDDGLARRGSEVASPDEKSVRLPRPGDRNVRAYPRETPRCAETHLALDPARWARA